MTSEALADIARSVIVERGLPYELLTVTSSPSGWDVRLRRHARDILMVSIPDVHPVAIRVALQERLDAEL